MATIFYFPTEERRTRTSIGVAITKHLESNKDLDAVQKKDLKQLIMEAYDRYSYWDIKGNVAPPTDQPFTDEQIATIHKGMIDLGGLLTNHFRLMFSEIVNMKIEIYMLTISKSDQAR